MPGNQIRVLATGIRRGYLEELVSTDPYLEGKVSLPVEVNADSLSPAEQRAMLRALKDMLEAYVRSNEKIGKDVVKQMMNVDTVDGLINQLAIGIPMTVTSKQKVLEAVHILERFEAIMVILANEIEILQIKKDLQGKVKAKVDKNQKDYVLREQLKVIREELGESATTEDFSEFYDKLKKLNIPANVTLIETKAFSGCMYLAEITVASGNANYEDRGLNGIIDKANGKLILGCKNTTFDEDNTAIAAYAFDAAGIIHFNVTEIEKIESFAFNECELLNYLYIDNSVKTIESKAIYNCYNAYTYESKVFGKDGYAITKMYVKDQKYEDFLKEIQYLIDNKEEFKKRALENMKINGFI